MSAIAGQDQPKGPPVAVTSGRVLGPKVVTAGAPPIPPGYTVVDGRLLPAPSPPK